MNRIAFAAALLTLATFLMPSGAAGASFILYREIFPNNTTGDIINPGASTHTGWFVHEGANGTLDTDWLLASNAGDTGPTGNVPINSNPAYAANAGRSYLWNGAGANTNYLMWTNEYTVNRANWNVEEIRWFQRNQSSADAIRAAIQIGSNWYASDTTFQQLNPGWTSASDEFKQLDFTTAGWRSLNFSAGSALSLGAPTPLPSTGDVTGFGWYSGTRNSTLRLDSFEIRAERSIVAPDSVITNLTPNPTYSGVELWLDASDIRAVGAGANPADGAAVASWTDKVHAWSADSTGGAATYRATVGGLGGMAGVELDQREMTIPDASAQTALNPGTEPYTVFAVGASHTAGDDDSAWVRKGNWGSSNAGWSVMAGKDGTAVRANDTESSGSIGDRTSQRNSSLALNEFGVVTLNLSGIDPITGQGVLTGRLNGTNTGWSFGGIGPSANHTYYDGSITTNNLLTLGKTDAKSTLAEVLIYPGGLTPVQTLMVERYLGAKYGITLNYDGPEMVLYQETFDNPTIYDRPLSDAGWKIHWGDGAQIADYPAGGAVLSFNGFAIDTSNKQGDLLYWTEEYSFDLDKQVVTRVTWDNDAEASTAVRFAMQIDDDWYVSDDSFVNGAGDLDFLNATWQPLLFEPGSQLERPGTTTGLSILDLGGSFVTAFGLYDDDGMRHRYDNITIHTAIPEPSGFVLALTCLAVLGLMRRRRSKK